MEDNRFKTPPKGTTHLMYCKFMQLKGDRFYYWCLYDNTWQLYSDQSTPQKHAVKLWVPE